MIKRDALHPFLDRESTVVSYFTSKADLHNMLLKGSWCSCSPNLFKTTSSIFSRSKMLDVVLNKLGEQEHQGSFSSIL